jgi:hypothetical protein
MDHGCASMGGRSLFFARITSGGGVLQRHSRVAGEENAAARNIERTDMFAW